MCGRVDILAEVSIAVVKFFEAALGQCLYCRLQLPNCKSSSREPGHRSESQYLALTMLLLRIFNRMELKRCYKFVPTRVVFFPFQLGCKGCEGRDHSFLEFSTLHDATPQPPRALLQCVLRVFEGSRSSVKGELACSYISTMSHSHHVIVLFSKFL